MNKLFLRSAVSGAEGDGAEVSRLFPVQGFMNFDPFVLWDDFTVPPSAGFPDHPHRGFEGVTYVFEGEMQHRDNLGNVSTVTAGGLQCFTAGSGIVHSEMPSAHGSTRGIQMWVNLPHALKQIDPAYQQVDANEVPERNTGGATIRVLAGEASPLKLRTAVRYLDAQLEAGSQLTETMPSGFRGFVYLVSGRAEVNQQSMNSGDALFHDGDTSNDTAIDISAVEASRLMLCFGRPHGEPIHQHGPYVD